MGKRSFALLYSISTQLIDFFEENWSSIADNVDGPTF